MKLFSRSKPRKTAVLLALIIVAGGIPFVVGTHVNELLSPWRSLDDESTGNSLLDDALATAASTLDGIADNERIPRRDEPQVPATFFHDIFDPNDRIGGWGEWEPDARITVPNLREFGGWTEEERWHLDPSAAGQVVQVPWVTPAGNQDLQTRSYDIDRGYRFGDENGYPVPELTEGNPVPLSFSLLVSPLISLQSLPVQLPDERADVPGSGSVDQAVNADGNGTVDLTQQASGARFSLDGHLDHQDRIILYMDHMYHLVQAEASRNGDRAGVFLLDAHGNVLHNNYLPPLRGQSFTHTVGGFTGSFMGAQRNFTEEAFDLSPWAGQDVHIVFEVGSEGLDGDTPDQHFGNTNRFQANVDFFGWAISNVRVEGPAHMHNVRLDRVTHPSVRDPSGGLFAPTGTEPLQVLLLNRGRVTEDVRVRMTIDGIEMGECVDEVTVRGLEPGGAVIVDFVEDRSVPDTERVGCLDIADGDRFEARFEAEILARDGDVAPREDLYLRDNVLAVDVTGQGPDIRLGGRMVADPPLGSTNTAVTLTLPVSNRGASDVDVDLLLRIDRRHPTASDFTELDVHLDPSRVRFSDGVDLDQVVHVPGRGQASASWGFSVLEAGLYRVTVEATGAEGREFFAATAVVGALVAPEFSYDTRFDGTAFDDDTVLQGAWAPQSLLGTPPPCQQVVGRDGCLPEEEREVWELVSNHRAVNFNPRAGNNHPLHSALRAEIDSNEWLDEPGALQVLVSDVEVQFLHYAEDIRCTPSPFGATRPERACDVPLSGGSPASSAQSAPENRLSVRLVEGVVSAEGIYRFNDQLTPRPTEVGSIEVQHVGGSHYRNAYFSGQWLVETHRISIDQLLGQPSVPVARLSDIALEFVLESGSSGRCGSSPAKDTTCPVWRLGEASMRAIPEAGTAPMPLVHWTGLRDEAVHGNWFSYAYTTQEATLTGPSVPDEQMLYPNCPSDEANVRALEDNRFFCPVWSQRPVSDIVASEQHPASWSIHPSGFWSNSVEQVTSFQYQEGEGGIVDALLSPVFKVPDGEQPKASFEHRFQLHPYTSQVHPWTNFPSFSDTGMLMVRFFDPTGDHPATPFLPVYLEGGRFMRHDCNNYYPSHPDQENGCSVGLINRNSMVVDFDLSDFPILDYGDSSTSVLGSAVTTGDRGGNTGYGFNASGGPRETGDVGNAFARVDLRRCTPQGIAIQTGGTAPDGSGHCAVQFAFRMEVPDPRPVTSSNWNMATQKEIDRFALSEAGGAEGWFIDSFRIVKDDLTDFDLELVNAKIDTAYKWEEVGLGPGTEAVATLEVQNNGFFTVDKALFHVTVQDPLFPDEDHTWRFEQPSDAEFVLEEGESTFVNITFDLPPEDGNYRIAFGVDLLGDLIADEGIPLTDMDPSNDCRFLLLEGSQRSMSVGRGASGCKLEDTQSVPVFRNPELGMALTISPEAGRAGEEFPREVNVRIENDGNSIVKDAKLDLVVVRAAEGTTPEVHQWIVSESPLPGHSKSWTGLPLLDRQGDGSAALARIVLEEDGTYFVTAFLSPSQPDQADGHDWEVLRQIRLDAFDTIYADSFGSQRVEPDHPSMLSGEEMVPRSDEWRIGSALVPDDDGEMQAATVWRFGDTETGQYPNSADASLELPGIDLSSARRAILSISHKYDLEQGYDGARVEASIDGDDWLPLHPRGGYPGVVAAQNPFNGHNDPTDPAPAFTGDSFSRNPLTDGWVIDEFDLANLPDFTTPILVEQFNQDGFDGGPHIGSPQVQRPGDASITYHQDWRRPSTECTGQLENCWSRDNLNWQNPAPLTPGGKYFWSGSAGSVLSPAAGGSASGNTWRSPGTELFLTLDDLPDLDDQTVRVRYSYWKDVGGELTVEADFVLPSLVPTHRAATSGGWVDGTIAIPAAAFDEATEFQLRILYEDTLCTRPGPWSGSTCLVQVDRHNRGAAIDQIVLEVLSQQGGKAVVDKSVVLLNNGQAGEGVALGDALFATSANQVARNLPVDGSNGFCTRASPNNFGSILCEQVDGEWEVVDTWGWKPRDRIPPSPEAWGIDEQRTRRGEDGLVWRFGTEFDPIDHPGHTTYPANAHERLITPRVDLQGVAGESAFLSYWERYDLMRHDLLHPPGTSQPNNALDRIEGRCGNTICYDERSVYVQVVEPTPEGGERLSEWQKLAGVELVYRDAQADPEQGRFVFDDYRVTRSDPRGEGCTDDVPAWCPVEVDISDYIGQKVRFAFDIKTNRLDLEPGTTDDDHLYGLFLFQTLGYANHASRADPPQVMTGGRGSNAWGDVFGWSWMIDEVGVKADSLVGQPVQLRLRAATDSSINEGAWMVENVQLVGSTYESNVAILPNETIGDLSLAPGETFEMSGLIRNLGPFPQRNIYLALLAKANEEEADLPEVRFLLDGDGEPEENVTHRIGPIFLGSAGPTSSGELLDRIPYKLQVELPEAFQGTIYSFRFEIQEEDGALLDDKNLGDHLREFQVNIRVDDNYVLPPALHVDRPTLETAGETARFSLSIDNTGSMRLGGQIWTNVTRLADGSGARIDEEATSLPAVSLDAIMAGTQGTVEWEWTPGEDFEPGFYRIEATVEPTTAHGSQTRYAHVLVGGLPIYYVEDFAQDPFTASQWTRSPACVPGQTTCWRTSTVFQDHGGQSLFIGNDVGGTNYPAVNPPPGNNPALATTPAIDLSFLARDPADRESAIVTGQSPFKPYLSARYHPTLAGSDDVTVEARSGDTGDYRALLTGDPLGGRSNDMQVASFPLFEENNNVLGTGVRLLNNDNSSFQFNTERWSGGNGFGFALDLLTISSYDVEVDPPRHDIDLRLGSDKVFYFKVENTGAASDTYSVAIDPDRTADIFQSAVVTAEVLTPEISLEPGGSALAEVRVNIPFQRLPDLFTGTEIAVTVTSGVDPNRVGTGIIAVDRFIEADLADLVTDLRRPRGESGPVVEGEQATFIVSVANNGDRASRATDLVVFACRTQLLDEDGDVIEEISLKKCGDQGLATEIGAVPLPPLVPAKDAGPESTDHVSTRTFSWVPPLGSRGEYQVVAVADPRQIVVQFDRSSSIDTEDLTVAPIERPDLVVTGLRVTDASGNEVRQAFAGETLHIQGTVENLGHAPAPNVKVRIVNQFNLRDERIGDLNPGATRTMSAQWVAQPGNWVILFGASTAAVEIDSDNNAQRWSLAVRSGTLQTQWDPPILHLDPGQSGEAVLRIDNRRDGAVDLVASANADDLTVQGVPGRIELARGASTQVSVMVTASPFAEAGRHMVDVELVQRDTGASLAKTSLEVQVGAERGVRVATEPLFTPPGTARLPLTFTNTGTAPEAFTVRLEAPEEWTATVLQPSLRLASGASRTVEALIDIPAGTPAGRYQVLVEGGDIVDAVVWIDVIEQPVWRSVVSSVHSLGDRVEVMVRVENIGNAKAPPPFALDGSILYDVQPAPSAQEPGETRTYRLRVQDTSAVVLPGQDDEVPLQLRPQRPPVEARRLDVQNPGIIASGDRVGMRFGVHNAGDAVEGLPVRLWVDGVLTAEERLDLAAAESRDIDFGWKVAKSGPRLVTATIGSGDDAVARTVVLNVDAKANSFAIPGPGLLVLLPLFAAAAVIRRRRDP